MVPGIATLIPFYVLLFRFPLVGGNDILGFGGVGLIDSYAAFLLIGLVSPYNIFLIKQYFGSVSTEYKESAEIDGAGFLRIVFTIYVPQIVPVMVVVIVGLFVAIWNDYMLPLILIRNNDAIKPVGLLIVETMEAYGFGNALLIPDYPAVFGISIISMIPPVLVYSLAQKQFISGISLGGIKG